MTKWIMKFEVETNATFIIESKEKAIINTRNNYEVYIQNNSDREDVGKTFLYIYIIYESENIDTAEKEGMKNLEDIIDILSFSSCVLIEIKRRIGLYDWTPNLAARPGRAYRSILDPNSPQLIINREIVGTLEALLRIEKNKTLERALRWFRLGVSSIYPEEQFQLFWFVIESLIQVDADKQRVADKCPRCGEPLFCKECNETSYHRPYPIQAIGRIFDKYVPDDNEKTFIISSKTRNALLHGESIKEIEEEFGITIHDIVTKVGKVAQIALLNCIMTNQSDKNQVRELSLYQSSNFSFYVVDVCANVTAVTSENNILTVNDFPDIKIDIKVN